MSLKQIVAKALAKFFVWKIKKWSKKPMETQNQVFKKLISQGQKTSFGKDHNFKQIKNHEDFSSRVKVQDYEGLKPYFDRVINAEKDVLWPGLPIYFAKTSGTTSGIKHIPITKDSMPTHINGSRDAIFHYINETGNTDFLKRKVIFLQGSPVLDEIKGIKTGRLSGIVAHYTPTYLKNNIMPSWETNCIEDWEKKVDCVTKETKNEDMAVIGGIPPWVQMYFEKLIKETGKTIIGDLFPNFKLFVYGGVNYEPYRDTFTKLIGNKIDSIEYFPASEGFFAYQDSQKSKDLLLQLNSGIFYEFIKLEDMEDNSPKRHTVKDVEKGINYVMIISTSAGLWAYNTGDTVSFTSLFPHKILVTGRYKHFISAFGEHVIGSEVEKALKRALNETELIVNEFTVAPKVKTETGLPFHEWWIEFEHLPNDKHLKALSAELDSCMQSLNAYYKDLIEGKILKPLEIVVLKKGTFNNYMKNNGKLGGQNKLPRLSNNRKIVEEIKINLQLSA